MRCQRIVQIFSIFPLLKPCALREELVGVVDSCVLLMCNPTVGILFVWTSYVDVPAFSPLSDLVGWSQNVFTPAAKSVLWKK